MLFSSLVLIGILSMAVEAAVQLRPEAAYAGLMVVLCLALACAVLLLALEELLSGMSA